MYLTRQTEIAIGVLVACARRNEKVAAQELAQETGATRDHIYQVVALLVRNGFLQSARGPGGGLRLAMAAETIHLADILRLTQPEIGDRSLGNSAAAGSGSGFILDRIMATTSSFLVRLLDRFTIADLLAPQQAMQLACLECGLVKSGQAVDIPLQDFRIVEAPHGKNA